MTEPTNPSPDVIVESALEIEGARELLMKRRRDSVRKFWGAVLASGAAAVAIGIELVGTLRGRPVFGWLVPVLFAGFSIHLWSRWGKARSLAEIQDDLVVSLEMNRPPPPLPPATE